MQMIAHSYDSYDHAVRAVNALEAAGVPHNDISLVSGDQSRATPPGMTGTTDPAGITHAPADEATTGAGTGASLGTLLGGGAGLLAGIGALAIPGVGPVVAAGWLVATLTGAGVGAATGGLLGSLTGAGVSEADATTYAAHVGRGGTLVTVRASDDMVPEIDYILEHGEARSGASLTSGAGGYAGATGPNYASVPGATGGTVSSTAGEPGTLRDNPATRGIDSTLGTNVSGENPARKI